MPKKAFASAALPRTSPSPRSPPLFLASTSKSIKLQFFSTFSLATVVTQTSVIRIISFSARLQVFRHHTGPLLTIMKTAQCSVLCSPGKPNVGVKKCFCSLHSWNCTHNFEKHCATLGQMYEQTIHTIHLSKLSRTEKNSYF